MSADLTLKSAFAIHKEARALALSDAARVALEAIDQMRENGESDMRLAKSRVHSAIMALAE